MAGKAQTIKLEIAVGVDGLLENLKLATKGVDQAASQFSESFKKVGTTTKDVGKEHDGLLGKLKEFKSEQVQQARMSRFYAGELASIIPAASGARGAIQGLLGVALEGATLGGAFEGAKFIIEQVAIALEESAKHAREVRQAHREMSDAIDGSMQKVLDGIEGPLTKTNEAWREHARTVQKEVKETIRAVQDYEKEGGKLRAIKDWLYDALDIDPTGAAGFSVDAQGNTKHTGVKDLPSESAKTEMYEVVDGKLEEMDNKRGKRKQVQSEEDKRRAADVDMQILQIHAQAGDEIDRIEADTAAKLREIQLRSKELKEDANRLWVATVEESNRKVAEIERHRVEDFQNRVMTAQASLGTEQEKAEAALEVRLSALHREFENRKSAEDQARLAELIDAEENAGRRAIAAAMQRDRERVSNEIEAAASKEIALTQLQDQALNLRYGLALGAQLTALQKQEEQDVAAMREAQAKHLISFEEMEQRLSEIHASYNRQRAEAAGEFMDPFLQPLVANWMQGLEQMLAGTYQWSRLVSNIFMSIVGALQSALMKALAEWLITHAKMLAGAIFMRETDTANTIAAEAVKTGAVVGGAVAQVQANAAVGASAAGASAAVIPGVGWAIAIPAAAAVFGALIGYSLASAAGGYDIPGNVNPLVQAHANEMILPAKYADVIRGLADGEGGGGGSGGLPPLTINIHALDGASVRRVLMDNQGELVKVLMDIQRKNRKV